MHNLQSYLLLLVASLFTIASAGSFDSPSVKALSATNFKKEVLGTDRATVACFYAPWCGHCQRLAPEYEKAAKNLAGLVDFVAINCDEDENKGLCGEYGVRGFPTIKVFGGPVKAKPEDYMGERTAAGLVKEATRSMPSYNKRIKTEDELQRLISKVPKKPIVLLLTDKISPPTLYKALSADHRKNFSFYSIKDGPEFADVKKVYGISKVPSLLLWKGGDDVEIYGGPLKIGHIAHWLKQAAGKNTNHGSKDEL